MNQDQAINLANKLDKLNEYFDMTTSTVDELSKYVDNVEEPEIVEDDASDNIITIGMLKEDFKLIRSTLIDTVTSGRKVITGLSVELEITESTSGSMISAYAELVGVVNNSLKLLTSTYKDIIDMNNKLTDNAGKGSVKTGPVSITNNTIHASVQDIIAAMPK